MDFSDALKWLKEGHKATRNSWEPYGQHLAITEIGLCMIQPIPEGRLTRLWQPSDGDLLAGDWLVATADGTIAWPDGTTDTAIKDAFPEKVADDMPWLTAGWPRLQRQPVDNEHYEALRRDVAEMLDSLRQLTARPKTDLWVTRISLPEDLDAEKVQRELRFAFGLCGDCGKRPCACLRSAPCPDLSHEIEHDAHEWEAPVDGHVHCPGWPPVADADEGQG